MAPAARIALHACSCAHQRRPTNRAMPLLQVHVPKPCFGRPWPIDSLPGTTYKCTTNICASIRHNITFQQHSNFPLPSRSMYLPTFLRGFHLRATARTVSSAEEPAAKLPLAASSFPRCKNKATFTGSGDDERGEWVNYLLQCLMANL